MKTIYTTLPIYDKLSKQCYQRAKRPVKDKEVVNNKLITIYCPYNELPSFQWKDDGDGCTSVSRIDMIDEDGSLTNITSYFTALPALNTFTSASYFIYEGGVLNNSMTCGKHYLKITMNNALVYYSEWFCAEDVTDFMKIDFYNTCDLYNIVYQTGFQQTIWLQGDTIEPTFPMEDEGVKNGEGTFIRSFARQTKKYSIKTAEMPDYMVDVFNRMKLHDSVQLTDLVGDVNDMLNLEVDHEWLWDDKYWCKIDLTFDYDEVAIISGCCNNIE